MTAILTAAEMRALEQAAIASGEVTGLELMERAGRGVVEAILAEWPGIEEGARRAVVLCGPGNNGGDGFVVARVLRERGWETTLHMRDAGQGSSPDATTTRAAFEAAGGITVPMPDPLDRAQARSILGLADNSSSGSILLVDAMFGTGLTRSIDRVDGDLCALLDDMGDLIARSGIRLRIAAVDIPSGLCADSGRVLTVEGRHDEDPVIRADLTVTFHGLKLGHSLGDGPQLCGSLHVVDIGLDRPDPDGACHLVDRPVEWRLAKGSGHKYAHGHAVVLSGGAGRGGAARMAARGALRIGAGLVTLAVPSAALQENAAALNAVMLKSVRDPEALSDYLSDARINAFCVGPGFGTGERQAAMLAALLDASQAALDGKPGQGAEGRLGDNMDSARTGAPAFERQTSEPVPPMPEASAPQAVRVARTARKARAVVLDADALTLLALDPALRAKLHAACVLTPHEGEFARLFPTTDAKWRAPATAGPAFSKVDAAREAAREAGCVVLLKGPDTVIAAPDGRAAINAAIYDRAAPWLATAGSGDVLAGFITGLLARGFAPFDAACTGAWLHVECARSFGPGLIAEDLPEELPKVFRAFGL